MSTFRPQDVEFFEGEQELSTTIFEGQPSNGQTRCTHRIRWEWLMSRTIACAHEDHYKVEKKRGIKIEERNDLEASLSTSLGVQFLAKLDLALKAKLGSSLTLESVTTETEEFQYKGKDCYQMKIDVYQLQSILKLEFEWKPLVGKKKYWETEVHVSHPRIHQEPECIPRHADCGCSDAAGEKLDYLQVRTPTLTLVEPYIVHSQQLYFFNLGMMVDNGRVIILSEGQATVWPPSDELPRNWSVDLDDVAEENTEALEKVEDELPTTIFPHYLRYLADLTEGGVTVVRFSKPQRGMIREIVPL